MTTHTAAIRMAVSSGQTVRSRKVGHLRATKDSREGRFLASFRDCLTLLLLTTGSTGYKRGVQSARGGVAGFSAIVAKRLRSVQKDSLLAVVLPERFTTVTYSLPQN